MAQLKWMKTEMGYEATGNLGSVYTAERTPVGKFILYVGHIKGYAGPRTLKDTKAAAQSLEDSEFARPAPSPAVLHSDDSGTIHSHSIPQDDKATEAAISESTSMADDAMMTRRRSVPSPVVYNLRKRMFSVSTSRMGAKRNKDKAPAGRPVKAEKTPPAPVLPPYDPATAPTNYAEPALVAVEPPATKRRTRFLTWDARGRCGLVLIANWAKAGVYALTMGVSQHELQQIRHTSEGVTIHRRYTLVRWDTHKGTRYTCDCRGHTSHGHCKHADALLALSDSYAIA